MNQLTQWYLAQVQQGNLQYDEAQTIILQQLESNLAKFKTKNNILNSIFCSPKSLLYIWGKVGRGKTMLMNKMFEFTPSARKQRVHFHDFMQETHHRLAQFKNQAQPLKHLLHLFKKKYDILYLDELHISDIANAMIFKSLIQALLEQKLSIIISSNYYPEELYPNGLLRERFLPAIKLILQNFTIISLNGDTDYRQTNHISNNLFLENNDHSNTELSQIFNQLAQNSPIQIATEIEIQGRKIPFIKKADVVIWFNFNILCGTMRSTLDYLQLAQLFPWIIISDITPISDPNIIQRFIWLIDVFYDNHNKIALSCNTEITNIEQNDRFKNEFIRTMSRLQEMKTQDYIHQILDEL